LFPVALTPFDAFLYPKNIFWPQVQDVSSRGNWPMQKGIYVLWRPWSVIDANLGHLLWEEIASMYYLSLQLPLFSYDPDLRYDRTQVKVLCVLAQDEIPSNPLFHTIVDTFLPVLSDSPLQFLHNYTRRVCFEKVVAGGAMVMFLPESRNLGKEYLFQKFRRQVLSHFHIPPPSFPLTSSTFHIVLTRKISTFLGGYRRRIENVDEVWEFLQHKCAHEIWVHRATMQNVSFHVSIETWMEKSMVEQIHLMHQTQLLITPPGGISMFMPFLPQGAHAIITDFYSSKAEHGFASNVSASMEAPFWNHWPHFKKLYYQVWPGDYVMDIQDSTDTRNYASVRMSLRRVNQLVNVALQDQGLFLIAKDLSIKI
jgi:hypothetical protein